MISRGFRRFRCLSAFATLLCSKSHSSNPVQIPRALALVSASMISPRPACSGPPLSVHRPHVTKSNTVRTAPGRQIITQITHTTQRRPSSIVPSLIHRRTLHSRTPNTCDIPRTDKTCRKSCNISVTSSLPGSNVFRAKYSAAGETNLRKRGIGSVVRALPNKVKGQQANKPTFPPHLWFWVGGLRVLGGRGEEGVKKPRGICPGLCVWLVGGLLA
jgi:hypothetical protein